MWSAAAGFHHFPTELDVHITLAEQLDYQNGFQVGRSVNLR
jgi:hypothetical protein